VPSTIALWKADASSDGGWPQNWRRVRTLFVSDGTTTGTDCRSVRASLGSSAAIAYDDTTERWNLFYVGFISCNDTAFVNRQGRIFRAESSVAGMAGIESTYTDTGLDGGIVLKPDDGRSQRDWEGSQGDDSMQPYSLGPGRGWASFFGSAGILDSGENHGQRVGLVTAPELKGPWTRSTAAAAAAAAAAAGLQQPVNPVNLSAWVTHIEQPIVTRLRDGSGYLAFFDALQAQGRGMVGVSFSVDGLTVRESLHTTGLSTQSVDIHTNFEYSSQHTPCTISCSAF